MKLSLMAIASGEIEAGQVTLLTRSGLDWTNRFPTIATSLAKLSVQSAWLDGEIVAEDEEGNIQLSETTNALDEKDGRPVDLLPIRSSMGRRTRSIPTRVVGTKGDLETVNQFV